MFGRERLTTSRIFLSLKLLLVLWHISNKIVILFMVHISSIIFDTKAIKMIMMMDQSYGTALLCDALFDA